MIYPVVMAGGSGTRLWPLSRELYPKQFLNLLGRQTLLQETITRLQALDASVPLLVCNEAHRFLAAEQLREIGLLRRNIILEPAARNTAPAIALAALAALTIDENALLLVLAADHAILDVDSFCATVLQSATIAEAGELITFGIVPTHAESGYGYIRRGKSRGASFQVAEFVEKPDEIAAQIYVDSGEYYWNSGMFLFRADVYLEELRIFRPDIYEPCVLAMQKSRTDMDFIRVGGSEFENCPSESIDYAIMEKTERAVVVPLDVGWNDVGGWSALWSLSTKDPQGNAFIGDVIARNTARTYVSSECALVATIGVEDLVIVQTKDAVLVADRKHAHNVRSIVEHLVVSNRDEHIFHREVFRPWGKYESLDQGERFQVKRITVKPGEKLSVQMHHHRAEHWIVVSGTANVAVDGREKILTENQSIYIPIGSVHSLENPGKIPLEIIEVQSGAYLGEDDIVRLEDRYGRE